MSEELESNFIEIPWTLPPGVEDADPARSMADNIRLIHRLRELLRQQRVENRAAFRGHLLNLLEVADALDRILQIREDSDCSPEPQIWEGIRLTRKLLDRVLRDQGVIPLDLVGQLAEPAYCIIDGYQIRPDYPEETVLQEVIKGYQWGDEPAPLRRAVVIASRWSEPEE